MFLAVVLLLGAIAISNSWKAVQQSDTKGMPQRIVTLGQKAPSCSSHQFSSGLTMIGCSQASRGERRGGAFFMKPPE